MRERKSSFARANSSASCGSWNDVIELRNDSASSWTDAMRDSRDFVRPEATPGMACTAPVLRVLLDCPTSRLETPAASTTCHEPRSEAHTSYLQSLMRITYAVFCWTKNHKFIHEIHPQKATN